MEPIVNPKIKIDKRTKEYKESLQGRGAEIPEPEQLPPLEVVKTTGAGGRIAPLLVSEDVESTTTNGAVGCGVTTTLPTQKVEDKVDYSKKENNPGFKLCMCCGGDLEYNDDGSAKRRVQPELCHACVWRNNK